jgi:hypothetical protein
VVMARPCLHVREYTPEERQQSWYSKKEIKTMKSEGKKIAGTSNDHSPHGSRVDQSYHDNPSTSFSSRHAMDRRDDSDSSPGTAAVAGASWLRGLEGKTVTGLHRRRQLKTNAREAVLEEQERQWQRGIRDAEAIADAYVLCAELAQVSAYMLGLRDEREARSLVKSKSQGGSGSISGGGGNSLLQITFPRWQSFEAKRSRCRTHRTGKVTPTDTLLDLRVMNIELSLLK